MRSAAGVAAVVLVLAACGGSGADKAGGGDPGETAVLTLVVDDRPEVEELAATVERLSGGSIRIDIVDGWRVDEPDYEQRTIRDVQSGRADLANVGARIWDRLGVGAFRGLLAPFLIDSVALERRVLDVPLRERLLRSVEPLGLVGIAVLPGDLRRPAGITRPLVRPGDYRGATIGIRDGGVADATFRALGATTKVYDSGTGTIFGSGLDGAEFGLLLVADNTTGPGGERVRAVTANVVFWPKFDTVVVSRRTFDRLTPAQRAVLRRAGRESFEPQLSKVLESERLALQALCERGLVFAEASGADLAGLRAAAQPVYDELERDPRTRTLIGDIRRARRDVPPAASEQPRCPGGARVPAAFAELEGTWRSTATKEDVLATDAPQEELDRIRAMPAPRRSTIAFDNGRWVGRADDFWKVTGTYRLSGDVLRLTIRECEPVGSCDPGAFTEYTWSLYRDTLTLARIPGRWVWPSVVAKPWVRTR